MNIFPSGTAIMYNPNWKRECTQYSMLENPPKTIFHVGKLKQNPIFLQPCIIRIGKPIFHVGKPSNKTLQTQYSIEDKTYLRTKPLRSKPVPGIIPPNSSSIILAAPIGTLFNTFALSPSFSSDNIVAKAFAM